MVIKASFPPLPNKGAKNSKLNRSMEGDVDLHNEEADNQKGRWSRSNNNMVRQKTQIDTVGSGNSNETTERSSTEASGFLYPMVFHEVDQKDGLEKITPNAGSVKLSSDTGSSFFASHSSPPAEPTAAGEPFFLRTSLANSSTSTFSTLNEPLRSDRGTGSPYYGSPISTSNSTTCTGTCTSSPLPRTKITSMNNNNTSSGDVTSDVIWHDCVPYFEQQAQSDQEKHHSRIDPPILRQHPKPPRGDKRGKMAGTQHYPETNSATGSGTNSKGSNSNAKKIPKGNTSESAINVKRVLLNASHSNGDHVNGNDNTPSIILNEAQKQHTGTATTAATDPASHEQAIFEQRLCDDNCGVAVRKINQYGKSNLRYVKCLTEEEAIASTSRRLGSRSISSHSANSWGRGSGHIPQQKSQLQQQPQSHTSGQLENSVTTLSPQDPSPRKSTTSSRRVLLWGKKKDVQVPLECFVCVRKGKTTERARKSQAPASRVLSLITNFSDNLSISLDIEAPTKLDRDKFARAFARFLSIPLESDGEGSIHTDDWATQQYTIPINSRLPPQSQSALPPVPTPLPKVDMNIIPSNYLINQEKQKQSTNDANLLEFRVAHGENLISSSSQHDPDNAILNTTNDDYESFGEERNTSAILTIPKREQQKSPGKKGSQDEDDVSHISSLTKNGFDQELVEELHNALNELRLELEESRAEAARAVKVAEQAIQSAERNNSVEWQNTVTHKAAEAAARAQKQSAAAIAKARLAEEKLEGERRAAIFWRNQAEAVEEEAGSLQTRAVTAEVQRAAVEEQLRMERRLTIARLDALRTNFEQTDVGQRNALDSALSRNRTLELELDSLRSDFVSRKLDLPESDCDTLKASLKKKRAFGRRKKGAALESVDGDSKSHLLDSNTESSSSLFSASKDALSARADVAIADKLIHLHAFTKEMRREFELMRRATVDDVHQLPTEGRVWASQVAIAVNASKTEVSRLQEQLAMESAARRKLLNEVQDLRETVRVYCRPFGDDADTQLLSILSRDTLELHIDHFGGDSHPQGQSFEYDRVFAPSSKQDEVYAELEDVCLSVLDGYNTCVMALGPARSGKTHTILGEVDVSDTLRPLFHNFGLQLKLIQQLFAIAEHRKERYKDSFSISIVEVFDEKLFDLLSGTDLGETRGDVTTADQPKKRQPKAEDDSCSSKPVKLEIRTDVEGETIVQGLLSVEVNSFNEVLDLWEQCIKGRQQRIGEQGMAREQYQASSHILSSLKVSSINKSTGNGSIGKIQFVDFASADVVGLVANEKSVETATPFVSSIQQRDWRFSNRSLETLYDVVEAKTQFERVVPYRNSTLTHLLQDSLEGDTKVVLIACVSTNADDVKSTAATLRFASRLRRLHIGKATRHTLS